MESHTGKVNNLGSCQLNDFLDWSCLQQVFRLEQIDRISKTGRTRHRIFHGMTSLPAELAISRQLLQILRSYWQIENHLHYARDVTLQRTKPASRNLLPDLIARPDFVSAPSARRHFPTRPGHALNLLL